MGGTLRGRDTCRWWIGFGAGKGGRLTAIGVGILSLAESDEKQFWRSPRLQSQIWPAMNPQNDSPLALSFEEALQPHVFLLHLRTSAENQVKRELGDLGNDAFKTALAGAKFILDSNGMQVVFEGGIPEGAKLVRDRAGKALATLVDADGKFLKNARELSNAAKAAKVGLGAALAIVEVAHMISGHDNAKRLKRVEGATDALLHAHKSELKSQIKAIYGHCKELINGDLNQLSEHDRSKLYDQCLKLRELRARWRDEFEHRLRGIKPAVPSWLDILLRRREEGQRKAREEKAREAGDILEMVQLMHFSLMLQMILAGASGRMNRLQNSTLPEECKSWQELMEFTSERAKDICGNSQAEEFTPFLDAMSDLGAIWSRDRWEEVRSQGHLGISMPGHPPDPIQCKHPFTQAAPSPRSRDKDPAIHLEYHEMEWFERREQERSQQKRTNRDPATNAAESFHRLHQDDGTQESGIDPDVVTDFEREQLRYNGGADSQYWNAE